MELDERLVERFIATDGEKAYSTEAMEKRSGSYVVINMVDQHRPAPAVLDGGPNVPNPLV
jgi:hypothetical protein